MTFDILGFEIEITIRVQRMKYYEIIDNYIGETIGFCNSNEMDSVRIGIESATSKDDPVTFRQISKKEYYREYEKTI